MIDLVIPVGVGSIWDNNELRYCIRSFVKYFDDLGKIYIVGIKPDFLKWENPRLIHIQSDDPFRHSKDANIINKVLKVCKRDDLSDDFIRSSDDQLILKKVQVEDFYPRYLINLSSKPIPSNNNNWFKRLQKTVNQLQQEKKTVFHYESHYPMIYNKQSFIKIMESIPDVTVNTYYFNSILDEYKELGNLKLTLQKPVISMQEFLKEVKGKVFLGYNNKAIREPSILKLWIQNEFREKTEFEK